ncbi:hypothetical protein CBR_g17855 [Chara braunii]|uniref:Integrase catalytic domain-containing protein n=1 Tax=Chara braunii TaxID=69332 RepID=A0A388KVY7_CHABU|nr:hypothetical protein CBR_g17855 [Chara braunii]|eukprot:GBG74142.1 hypothetical protein CBR_g17855 [Chara braunii]
MRRSSMRSTRRSPIGGTLLGRFFYVRTDHQTLKWMRTESVLSDALKRWIEVIEEYDFDPQYIKGEYNKVADVLSRRPDFFGALSTEFGLADGVTHSMVEAYREDQFMSEIIRRLEAKDKITPVEFELVNGLLFLEKARNKRQCVPNRESLRSVFLGECHDATGQFGFKKTAANLLQRFWWPTMMRDAKLYVETCQARFPPTLLIAWAGLEPEATKVEVICNWPQPVNIRELRSFLGLASYYRQFVPRFSIVARPLSRLTSKNVPYSWDTACTNAFQALKDALVSYPLLHIADPKLTFVVTTDASQYGIGAVLQQDDGDGLRPLEYYSKRMPNVKVATSTYMRELYALCMALDHWKHYLLGRHFKVFSGHETLKCIKQRTTLSPTLRCWFHEIDIFDFELRHKKGCYNRVVDALSRYPEYITCLVKSYDLQKKLKEEVVEHTAKDPELSSILERQKPMGILTPLPIPDGPGKSVSIDFTDMGKVSKSGYSHVMVIVDGFSKFLNLIPLPPHAPTELAIREFQQKYILQFGTSKTLVSDRDPRFISTEWKDFTSQLGIKLCMTSGRHPEANGLAEEINQTVFQLLRALIIPNQETWDEELYSVKGLYNNSVHSATGMTPNRLHYGWQIRNPLSYLFPEQPAGLTPDKPGFRAKYDRLLKVAIAAMTKRQHAMIHHANKKRRPSDIQVGSFVWVKKSEFSEEEGVSHKLLPLYYGPWEVLDVIGEDHFDPSYVVDVPAHLRTYPVFHAAKLYLHRDAKTFDYREDMIPRAIKGGHEIDRIKQHVGKGRNRVPGSLHVSPVRRSVLDFQTGTATQCTVCRQSIWATNRH